MKSSSRSSRPSPSERSRLHRVLRGWDGAAVTLGVVVGGGIFRTPSSVMSQAGTPRLALIAWALGGLYSLLGAFIVAELAVALPRAGGPYVYVREGFGPYCGFLAGWADLFVYFGSIAQLGIVIAEQVSARPAVIRLLAPALVLVTAALQGRGVRQGALAQRVLTGAKLAALAAVTCLILGHGPPATSQPLSIPHGAFVGLLLAMPGVLWTYDGWAEGSKLAEETIDPAKALPRMLIGGLLAVTLLYVAINFAYVRVLAPVELAHSTLPAADALGRALGPAAGRLGTAVILLTIYGSLAAHLFGAPRVAYAMARDRLLPERLTHVASGGTPHIALAVVAVISAVLAATHTFDALLAATAFSGVLFNVLTFGALFVLRRRPGYSPPFRTPGYPWLPAAMLVGSVLFLAAVARYDFASVRVALIALALGYPVYRLTKRG